MRALHAAIDAGVNFIDTADVYGDGRSERLVARLRRERPRDRICVATKAGRRLPEQTCEGYTRENLTAWVDRSLQNLDTDAIDLLQLHCPPTDALPTGPRCSASSTTSCARASSATTASASRRSTRRSRRWSIRTCRACRSSSTCSG